MHTFATTVCTQRFILLACCGSRNSTVLQRRGWESVMCLLGMWFDLMGAWSWKTGAARASAADLGCLYWIPPGSSQVPLGRFFAALPRQARGAGGGGLHPAQGAGGGGSPFPGRSVLKNFSSMQRSFAKLCELRRGLNILSASFSFVFSVSPSRNSFNNHF